MRRCLVVVLTTATLHFVSTAHAQSFDCAKARTPVERAICAEPSLGALDQALAAAMNDALARPGADGPGLRAAQSAWLRQRDAGCKVAPAQLTACLTMALSARLAVLAPPAATPPQQAVGVPEVVAAAPAIIPSAPAIPAAANPPQADAVLERSSLSASRPGDAMLQVRKPGRFSLSARSASGTAIQVVDMMAGPAAMAGEPGVADGRTDMLLDTGTYKVRVLPGAKAMGEVQLTVAPFHDAAPPAATPDAGAVISGPLADLQQRAFWLAVGADGVVQIDAVGRALGDLRLWQGGTALAPLEPVSRVVEPVRGHPMLGLRLVGMVEPGSYLVVAYGGAANVWADGAPDMPFYLRSVAPGSLGGGSASGTIGAMGSEWFAAPPRSNLFWATLPAPAAAELIVDGQSDSIAANSREPVAVVRAAAGKVVEVAGLAGQAYHLRAQETSAESTFAKPGRWWMSASMLGAGGEEVPPTALLLQHDGNGPGRVLASTAPLIRPAVPWRSQFNVRGPTTLLLQTSGAGVLGVRNASQGLGTMTWQPRQVQLPAGFNEYFMDPPAGKQGVADLVFSLGNAEGTVPAAAAWPVNPVIPFGVQTIGAIQQIDLETNTAPNLQAGLLARAAPVALAEGPLVLAQMPGVALDVPVRIAAGGTLAVSDPAAGDIAVPFKLGADGVGTVSLPAAEHPRTVVLSWRHPVAVRLAIPAPPGRGTASTLGTGAPRFLDLRQDEQRSFDLTVPEGGLYRIETTGRLHTTAAIGTAFVPSLDQAEANGVGENALLQRWLRAGSYRVRVGALASAGHLGLRVAPVPMLDGAELVPGGSIRARVAAGSGLGTPMVITEAGTYRLELLGQGRTFNARLDDAEGWPLTVPGPMTTLERDFVPGRYRLLVSPEAVDVRVVARLRRVLPAIALEGHGPHALVAGTPAHTTWREPVGRDDVRTPDVWTFTLDGSAEATLRITDGMVAELKRDGVEQPVLRLVGPTPFKGSLEPGGYRLAVTSLGRNDRLDYTVSFNTAELQPGVARRVDAAGTVPFTLSTAGVVSLTTFGAVPLTAVLRDAAGHELGRYGDRGDDWNVAISRLLPAGAYRLELKQAVPPDLADVAGHEAPVVASDGGGNSDSDDEKPAVDPGEPVAQSAPTAASTPAAPEQPDDGAAKADTEITLILPAQLEPVAAAAGVAELTSGGVHRLTLAQPEAGRLVLATARSSAAVVLSLERQEGEVWRSVAQAQGTEPVVAVPADGAAPAWRVAVWAVDGGVLPIRVGVTALEADPQAPGMVTPRVVETATVVAVARLRLEGPVPVRLAGPGLLAGGWPGHALVAPDGGLAVAQSDALWIVAPTAAPVMATVVAATPGRAVAVPVTAGSVARLAGAAVADGMVRAWRADSGLGQPGLDAGQGMGVAAGSALAVGTAPVRVWNAGDDTILRPRVTALDLAMQPAMRADGPVSVLLPAGSALHLTLPEGDRRTDLALAPGIAAVAGSGDQAITVWTGGVAEARSVPGSWTDLVLLNTGAKPAPASVAWTMGSNARLQPGAATKRFFGAAGAFDLLVDAPAGARLMLAGEVQATFIGVDGRVQRGGGMILGGPGRLTVAHAPGPLAVWLETPGGTAWPAVAAKPQSIPARVVLGGEAMGMALAIDTPMLLHARTTAPVILTLGRDAPTLYPAGAVLNRYVAAAAMLRIDSPQDGPLTGSLELEAEPVVTIGDGLGAPVALAPGQSAVFAFQVPRATEVGVGVRADPARAGVRLLAANGDVVAEGAAMLRRLEAGRYLIDVRLPPDALPTVIRPAVVGITPRSSGPPPEVARSYLALVGLSPKDGAPKDGTP